MNKLENLLWYPDRMILNDYLFRIEHFKNDNWDGGENYFLFYKIRELVDQYALFFKRFGDVQTANVFELGVWGGGSIPFWNELLHPDKHIGIDLREIVITDYIQGYLDRKKAQGKVIQYFGGVDQADKEKLRQLHASVFNAPLDIVIDDASHLYHQSKASFEALFPLLRPGGLYIIEDWAWGHWEEFITPNHFWAHEIPPTKLIHELTELAGTNSKIIRSMQVYQGFVVVERGDDENIDSFFDLEKSIVRREEKKIETTVYRDVKNLVKKVLKRNSNVSH